MNKQEFMKELEFLLQDISEEDKREAIEYYYDYFEDAGEANQAGVIMELGSPERIAAIIRADLNASLGEGGEFTENGYEDSRFKIPNRVPAEFTEIIIKEKEEQVEHQETKRQYNKPIAIVLLVAIGLVCIPVLLKVLGSILGVIIGSIVTILMLLLVPAAVTLGFFGAGVFGMGFSLAYIRYDAIVALTGVGGCIMLVGLSICLIVFCRWFYGRLVPMFFRMVTGVIGALLNYGKKRRRSE